MKKLITVLICAALLICIAAPVLADSSDGAGQEEENDAGNAVPTMADTDWVDYDYESVDASIFDEDADAIPTALSTGDIKAPYAILMEKETGAVIFEKDADTPTEPASVTKVMTILLIVEAVESGAISLEDMVSCSATAAAMGGSQIFLEEGEQMSVRELLKSIVVSSANDASVCMAEHLAGTESAFVALMNQRAQELGMENTNFCNCTGLPGDEGHLTTARDIAIMSRELISHEMIKDYTTIWMDSIRDGQFGLSNTNKLIYYYSGATGLKTGFTAGAQYCLAATALRDGVEYIAVVLKCESSADRFESAKTMLSYAFANYTLINAAPEQELSPIPVTMGMHSSVNIAAADAGQLLVTKAQAQNATTEIEMEQGLTAPVAEGMVVGHATVKSGDTTLAVIPLVTTSPVARRTWWNVFCDLLNMTLCGR